MADRHRGHRPRTSRAGLRRVSPPPVSSTADPCQCPLPRTSRASPPRCRQPRTSRAGRRRRRLVLTAFSRLLSGLVRGERRRPRRGRGRWATSRRLLVGGRRSRVGRPRLGRPARVVRSGPRRLLPRRSVRRSVERRRRCLPPTHGRRSRCRAARHPPTDRRPARLEAARLRAIGRGPSRPTWSACWAAPPTANVARAPQPTASGTKARRLPANGTKALQPTAIETTARRVPANGIKAPRSTANETRAPRPTANRPGVRLPRHRIERLTSSGRTVTVVRVDMAEVHRRRMRPVR